MAMAAARPLLPRPSLLPRHGMEPCHAASGYQCSDAAARRRGNAAPPAARARRWHAVTATRRDTSNLLLGRSGRFLAFSKAERQALLASPSAASQRLLPSFKIEKLPATQAKKEGYSSFSDGAWWRVQIQRFSHRSKADVLPRRIRSIQNGNDDRAGDALLHNCPPEFNRQCGEISPRKPVENGEGALPKIEKLMKGREEGTNEIGESQPPMQDDELNNIVHSLVRLHNLAGCTVPGLFLSEAHPGSRLPRRTTDTS